MSEWETLLNCGGLVGAREKGKVRSEGKEYVIKDGDVVLFRFKSVIIFGNIEIVDDVDEILQAIQELGEKYYPNHSSAK